MAAARAAGTLDTRGGSLRKSYIILKLLQNQRVRKIAFQAVKSPAVRRALTRGVKHQVSRRLRKR